MKINKYPDGSSYVIEDAQGTMVKHVFKLNSYEDLWHLNQFVDAFNNRWGQAPSITISNLIDAQADRRFAFNQSSGLKLVCKFLNGMNANFRIFHPHNPEIVEALMENVEIIDNCYFIKEVLSEIYCDQNSIKRDEGIFYHVNHDLSNLTLMSSDAGGFKPLMKLCDQIQWKGETYSASKARTAGGMKQLIDKNDFEGKDILIVDDICVYGGTFKGLSRLLKERNCGKLYLAVSHMTIQQLGADPVTNYFDKVFTTNSKYDEYWAELIQPDNLEIIKMF